MGKKLLIVDDEIGIRESLAMYYESDLYSIFLAENGTEALKIVNEENIDFVLSDIRMPGGDGLMLLEEIRKSRSDYPIVLMMSGFSEVGRSEVIERGALDLLDKPIDFDKLDDYLEQYL